MVRMVFMLAAVHNLELDQIDIRATYLNALSQDMAGASKKQWDMGLDVARYLKGAKDLELTYNRQDGYEDLDVVAYADLDYANDKVSGKSVYGYVVYIGGNAVMWKSKKSSMVNHSYIYYYC
jgi:hypothetical protein